MIKYWRVLLVAMALLVVGAYQLYGVFSNAGYRPQQPINFSHVIHAGVLQMECLYCHHQAEKSASAGIPSVELCMGCHSIVRTDSPEIQKLTEYYNKGEPVPWVRIHRLPDHAYFSHKWHVQAGVACQECHGPIQNMPQVGQWRKLEMGDCVTCHRQNNFTEGIHHTPTYHDPLVAETKDGTLDEQPLDTREAGRHIPQEEAYASAKEYMQKYFADEKLDDKTAEKWAAQIAAYARDNYQHGRLAQLRGHNASVECSTCHY